jgi:protein SMG6
MLDILTDFIYDAYTFYTSLLEEQALAGFKTAWIEALGDLARYRMAIASHLDAADAQSVQPAKAVVYARIDDDEDDGTQPAKASIGADVAQAWDVEDRETWRTTARDWYAMGITEKPGEGRLHHHLALLCRDVHGEEAQALYHFSKRLVKRCWMAVADGLV